MVAVDAVVSMVSVVSVKVMVSVAVNVVVAMFDLVVDDWWCLVSWAADMLVNDSVVFVDRVGSHVGVVNRFNVV